MRSRSLRYPISVLHPVRVFSLLQLALGFALIVPTAQAQDVDIGVRSKVMDKDLQWSHKTGDPDSGGHSRTFGLLAIDEVKSSEKLIKPVNQENILRQLFAQLMANGFTQFTKGTKPDILLVVSYGRGAVENPYLHGQGEIGGFAAPSAPANGSGGGGPGRSGDGDSTSVTLSGAVATGQSVFDSKTPGYEAKLQKAGFEKLFIRVTAFAYPTDPKAKPKMLWKTVIVADDPDHRDLNAIAAEMLKSGAPYFDKNLKRPEIEFWHGVPQGQVSVGTPEVVPPKK